MGYPASHHLPPTPAYYEPEESGAAFKVAAVLLGVLVAIMAVVGLFILAAALGARNDARDAKRAAVAPAQSMAGMPGMTAAPADRRRRRPGRQPELRRRRTRERRRARRRARRVSGRAAGAPGGAGRARAPRHQPSRPPDRPGHPLPGVDVLRRRPRARDPRAPGPDVKVTLTNNAPMPHSVDFHAAQVAPNEAFTDIAPGKSFTFSFKALAPGVFMYHCGTKPVLAHIANGMYGAIVVDPVGKNALPPVHHAYVLVSGEWYLNAPGLKQPPRSTWSRPTR